MKVVCLFKKAILETFFLIYGKGKKGTTLMRKYHLRAKQRFHAFPPKPSLSRNVAGAKTAADRPGKK